MSPTERLFPGSAPAAVGRGLVASSFQYYLSGDENLRIETISSNVPFARVQVTYRLWREVDRSIQVAHEDHACSPSSGSRTDYRLDAGALLNLRLGTLSTNAIYGWLFVRAQLIRGSGPAAEVIGTLLQGYLSTQNDLAWPGSPLQHMHEGRGVIFDAGWVVTGTPSLDMTVPAGVRRRVVAGRCELTTSAVAGNRYLVLAAASGIGRVYFSGIHATLQGPGTTVTYAFGSGIGALGLAGTGIETMAWADDIELREAEIIRVALGGGQLGDLLVGHALLVREWMDQ